MRILFSIDHLYLHGGAEKVLSERVNYFVTHFGYDVFILTTEQKNNPVCYELHPKVTLIDIAMNYNRSKSYFHPENISKLPTHYLRFRKVMNEVKPDVVVVLNYAFDFYFIPFVFTKIPKFKEYHSSRFFIEQQRLSGGFVNKMKFRWIDFINSKYDKIILLNPDEKRLFKNNNTVVIPNPVDLKNDTASLVNPFVMAAGRIAPVKGFDKLIKAWKIVSVQAPQWQLHIFGQGEPDYISVLQELIEEKQLQEHVILKNAVPDLSKEMVDYSFYVMSSKTECFPMVLLESFAVGLPVVSFDCPTGPRNIVNSGYDGILVDNQDINQLAEKIVLLITNNELRLKMGRHAKKTAEQFSKVRVMNSWKTILEQ